MKTSIPALIAASAVTAWAANPHFVGGITVTDIGTMLRVTGKIAGVGNGDLTIVVDAEATATVQCRNPGGHVAPGHTRTIHTGGSTTIASTKNGAVTFGVTTLDPVDAALSDDSCPNRKWTPELVDVDFLGGSVTVWQGGQVVLTSAF